MHISPKILQEKREYDYEQIKMITNESVVNYLIKENFVEKKEKSNSTVYVFRYVGIIYINKDILSNDDIEDHILMIYPKYLTRPSNDSFHNHEIMKTILKVLFKSNIKKLELNSYDTSNDKFVIDKFSTIFNIIQNYISHGLYNFHEEYLEINGEGEIDWDSTISINEAHFFDSFPHYLDVFTREESSKETYLIILIHQAILQDISFKYESLLELVDLDFNYYSDVELSHLGDIDYLLYLLYKEYKNQYIDYKREQISLMIDYISHFLSKDQIIDNIAIGSFNFENVWEEVCKNYYTDNLQDSITDLGYVYNESDNKELKLKDIITAPNWKITIEGSNPPNQKLRPDIVRFIENKMEIIDAKYYTFDVKPLISFPGVEDITKQYLYQLAYSKFIRENKIEQVNNFFIIPSENTKLEDIGEVSYDIFDNIEGGNGEALKSIKVLKAPAMLFYKNYLDK